MDSNADMAQPRQVTVKKYVLYEIVFVFVALIVIVAVLQLTGILKLPFLASKTPSAGTPASTVHLPVALDDKSVLAYNVTYLVSGWVEKIQKDPKASNSSILSFRSGNGYLFPLSVTLSNDRVVDIINGVGQSQGKTTTVGKLKKNDPIVIDIIYSSNKGTVYPGYLRLKTLTGQAQ